MKPRSMPFVIAFGLLAMMLAGCVQPDATDNGPMGGNAEETGPWSIYATPAVPDYDFASAFDVVHAHDVRELHTDSYGLERVGHSFLLDGLAPHVWSGGFIEVDVKGDLAVVASLTGMRAFTLVDISDVTSPQVLSHFYGGNDNWDVRISDDMRYAFVGCQGDGLYTYLPLGSCTDHDGIPSAGEQDQGIVTVDISDPRDPEAVCWSPSQSNHNIFTATLDDGTTVVANNHVELFVLQADGCLDPAAEVPGGHDAHIDRHPVTGEWLLYTGAEGMSVYKVDDPRDPELLGELETNDVEGATGWHEQSPAPVLYGDVHVTMGGGERFGGAPGAVTAIDTTDPQEPTAMGTWRLPVEAPLEEELFFGQQSYMFSEHNVAANAWGQVCVGHYHAGVWVLDVSTPERMQEPVTLGFYQPHEFSPEAVSTIHPAGGKMTESPYVWGCAWTEDGRHVVVADMHSGLYILEGGWFEPVAPEPPGGQGG